MTDSANNSKSKSRKKTMIIILLLLILIAAVAAGAYWWFFIKSPYNDKLDPNATVGTMPGTQDDLQAQLDEATARSTIGFALNLSPVFADGTSEGDIMYQNPANSQKYTRLELYIDDTNELIYKTKLIEPGSYIEYARLDVDLDAGTYACTAYIYGYMLDTEEYVGKVAADVDLVVES